MYKVYDQVLNDFSEIMKTKHYKKGEIVHKSGKICDEIYFVKLGILRSFYFKDGKDVTAHIAIDNGIISPIDSLVKRVESRYTIQALENSEVLEVNFYDLEDFLAKNPKLERSARLFTQEIYMELAERVESLMFHDAQERYSTFIEKYPTIVQRVSLNHIASFLGISQETLSRVRSNYN